MKKEKPVSNYVEFIEAWNSSPYVPAKIGLLCCLGPRHISVPPRFLLEEVKRAIQIHKEWFYDDLKESSPGPPYGWEYEELWMKGLIVLMKQEGLLGNEQLLEILADGHLYVKPEGFCLEPYTRHTCHYLKLSQKKLEKSFDPIPSIFYDAVIVSGNVEIFSESERLIPDPLLLSRLKYHIFKAIEGRRRFDGKVPTLWDLLEPRGRRPNDFHREWVQVLGEQLIRSGILADSIAAL